MAFREVQPKLKTNKKVKFITQEAEKSQTLPLNKTRSHKNILLTHLSSLNDLEDFNIGSKQKSDRKDLKYGQRDKKEQKIKENSRNQSSHGNIKFRNTKSRSKNHKLITLTSFENK